jgi:hypothetical protein
METSQVARLRPHLSAADQDAFEAAYGLDENAVPPAYVLRSREGTGSAS